MSIYFHIRASSACIALTAAITLTGCGQDSSSDKPSAPAAESHEHPMEGPHHGSLIELGNEEYHAELLHDAQTGTVTVYILDSAAQQPVTIDATELMVNLSHEGQAEQFSFAASPESRDPAGQSSRFTSSDAELAKDLDDEHADAQIVVTINGKQYRGAIAHDHEHAGHDHNDE